MSTSTVASLIDFEAEESPFWWERTGQQVHTVKEMVKEIIQYQNRWRNLKDSIDENIRKKVDRCFLRKFLYHSNNVCNTTEAVESYLDTGVIPQKVLSKTEREPLNIQETRNYLFDEVKKVQGSDEAKKLHGLLEINLVKYAHSLVLKDIELPEGYTRPGTISNKRRITYFEHKMYEYASPKGLEQKVQTLLDRYNDLITHCVKEAVDNLEDQMYKMFKTCGFLLFELLDLHPFCKGNGRLCRLLCNYVLSSVTPFPTPIYNGWSESKKDDYYQALVDARESTTRHPKSLTTMIIESNYHGWKKFFEFLEEGG